MATAHESSTITYDMYHTSRVANSIGPTLWTLTTGIQNARSRSGIENSRSSGGPAQIRVDSISPSITRPISGLYTTAPPAGPLSTRSMYASSAV